METIKRSLLTAMISFALNRWAGPTSKRTSHKKSFRVGSWIAFVERDYGRRRTLTFIALL
jgi:hypothetical protein